MMNLLKWLIFCYSISLIFGLTERSYEKCKLNTDQKTFDVLPGVGWDNLANMEMGRILDLNFSKCYFSNDNRYLIPNQLSLSPEKSSRVELFSETFRHFSEYKSEDSSSINVDVGGGFHGFKIGGSFSKEYSRVKTDQLETKSLISRVQLRYKIYQSMFEPDTLLYPTFKNRIMDIAGLVVENKDSLYPEYLSDMIIRDYGTHLIRSIDAGAILSKTDALKSEYVKTTETDTTTISTGASASFLSFFNFDMKYKTSSTTSQKEEYEKGCAKTHIDVLGGVPLGNNASISGWIETVPDNLVAIDRRGDPIYYAITPRALPELDDDTVNKVYNLLKKAVKRYYTRNTRMGCLNIYSPNFNEDANVNSGNCSSPVVNFTLGGVYQTCSGPSDQCNGNSQLNPLTGSYSCPTGFTSVKLHNGLNQCQQYCSGWWLWRSCHTDCSYFETYWCSPKHNGENKNGYRFGGVRKNSQTPCPLGYISLKVGNNIEICVTTDADITDPYAIQFGGFYSCSVGNPLARLFVKDKKNFLQSSKMTDLTYWPKSCANGYVSNIATIDQGCQISYCTETNKVSFGPLPNLIKPPFIKLNFNPNSTKITVFSNKKGETFIKDNVGTWKIDEFKKQRTNTIVGSVVGSILCTIAVCIIIGLLQRRYFKRKLNQMKYSKFLSETNVPDYGSVNNTEEALTNFA